MFLTASAWTLIFIRLQLTLTLLPQSQDEFILNQVNKCITVLIFRTAELKKIWWIILISAILFVVFFRPQCTFVMFYCFAIYSLRGYTSMIQLYFFQ